MNLYSRGQGIRMQADNHYQGLLYFIVEGGLGLYSTLWIWRGGRMSASRCKPQALLYFTVEDGSTHILPSTVEGKIGWEHNMKPTLYSRGEGRYEALWSFWRLGKGLDGFYWAPWSTEGLDSSPQYMAFKTPSKGSEGLVTVYMASTKPPPPLGLVRSR